MKTMIDESSPEALLAQLKTSFEGLTTAEASRRLKIYGPNSLAPSPTRHLLREYLLKFKSPLVLILLLASALSALTGELVNFVIIFLIVLLSTSLEFYQESASEAAAEKLKRRVESRVEVFRDGRKIELPLRELTVGDVVFVNIGDLVPADARVLETKDLHVDESTLTGESFPVQKEILAAVFLGTSVVNGQARLLVTAVGEKTELGKISQSLEARRPPTDFETGLRKFGFFVVRLTLILVVFVFLVGSFLHHQILDSFLFALALAVGLTPELLPMIVTVNLSRGALRMAKKGVIVKSLPAIQNLGGLKILCADKTGTLTENKIELERYEDVEGVESQEVLRLVYLNSFFQSNFKSPLDEAILIHREVESRGFDFQKIDEIPFDFERKMLSVVLAGKNHHRLICKGAPEAVLKASRFYQAGEKSWPLTPEIEAKIIRRFDDLSSQGFRVLAVATRVVPTPALDFGPVDEKDLVFAGLTAFLDPPKKEVREVLKSLEKEGLELKILTGDNERTTRKVCEELAFPVLGVVEGRDPAFENEARLAPAVFRANLFVRLTPAQKDQIIKVLKSSGQVVGFLGDGVNDASSLREADVGISVANAVDVAREAADLILLTKSLKVLRDGVLEGRKTFINVRKYIFVALGSNFGNMLSVSLASLFVPFLPMLPVQILLNNLIYDFSQLAIPLDNVEAEAVKTPQNWDLDFIKKFALVFGPLSSFFDFVTFFFLLKIWQAPVALFRTAWFVESLVTQCLIIFVLRNQTIPFFRSRPGPALVVSSLSAVALGLIISQSGFGRFFNFVALPSSFWLFLAALLVLYSASADFLKFLFYRSQRPKG